MKQYEIASVAARKEAVFEAMKQNEAKSPSLEGALLHASCFTATGQGDGSLSQSEERIIREAKAFAAAAQEATAFKQAVKVEHYHAVFMGRGKCPCCCRVPIIENGKFVVSVEFHRWNPKYQAGTADVWPVCGDCFLAFAEKRVQRKSRQKRFAAYQRHRRRVRVPEFRKRSGVQFKAEELPQNVIIRG